MRTLMLMLMCRWARLDRYMKVGQFTAISVGAGIDRHNVAAIVPLGKPLRPLCSCNRKRSSLQARLVGVEADRGRVCCFASTGGEGKATLVLSVDKETYEQLGLEGRKSLFKQTNRYSTPKSSSYLLVIGCSLSRASMQTSASICVRPTLSRAVSSTRGACA
jgi:hypothetical protein